jgi:hypothetical protein
MKELGATTCNITTLRIMTFNITTLSIMTFSIPTLTIEDLFVTLRISDTQNK